MPFASTSTKRSRAVSYENEPAEKAAGDPTLPAIDYMTSRITYDGMVVGSVAPGRVILDLGWMREAGLGITLRDDPEGKRHRGGITFER